MSWCAPRVARRALVNGAAWVLCGGAPAAVRRPRHTAARAHRAGFCTGGSLCRSILAALPGETIVGGNDRRVTYVPGVLSEEEAAALFSALRDGVDFRREVDDFGPQDRLSAYFGDPGCDFAYVLPRSAPAPPSTQAPPRTE